MPATIKNVEHLVNAMLLVMENEAEEIGASTEDVVSATFTLTLRTIKVAREMGCEMSEVKGAVGSLMLECMKDSDYTGRLQ